MTYESSKFTGDLKDDIERVESVLQQYHQDCENNIKYLRLKQAIYDLSLTIKHKVVNGDLRPAEAELMKDYFWGLLL